MKSTYRARPKFWRFEVPSPSRAPRTAACDGLRVAPVGRVALPVRRQSHQQVRRRGSDLQGELGLLGDIAAVQGLQRHRGVVGHHRDLLDPPGDLAEVVLRPPLACRMAIAACKRQSGSICAAATDSGYAARSRQRMRLVQYGEEARRPGLHRLEVEVDAVEALVEYGGRRRHHRFRTAGSSRSMPGFFSGCTTSPSHACTRTSGAAACTAATNHAALRGDLCQRQRPVVLQRARVHVEIADPGALQLLGQRGDVGRRSSGRRPRHGRARTRRCCASVPPPTAHRRTPAAVRPAYAPSGTAAVRRQRQSTMHAPGADATTSPAPPHERGFRPS